jgi:hypothetical protein
MALSGGIKEADHRDLAHLSFVSFMFESMGEISEIHFRYRGGHQL